MRTIVSVIMANYNTPIEYLKASIESILTQTYKDFEFIIIDDASTDESINYIESIDDSRIIVIRNSENIGLTKSLNIGLRAAKGKYIARMDSDDIAMPTRLAKQVEFMNKYPEVIVCGTWFEKFGIEEAIRKPRIDDFEKYRCQLLFNNTPITLCHPSAMLRNELLRKYGIEYNETFKKAQDYGLWSVCCKYGRLAIIEEVLLRYRTHTKQISVSTFDEQELFADQISKQQLEELGVQVSDAISRWRRARVNSIEDFKEFYKWLEKIKVANEVKGLYHKKTLNEYLNLMAMHGVKALLRLYGIKQLMKNVDFETVVLILKIYMKNK